MFIKTAGFRKLLKEAYNSDGIRIGNDGRYLYLSNSFWVIKMLIAEIPNSKLGAIVEFIGIPPEKDEYYILNKYETQMETGAHLEGYMREPDGLPGLAVTIVLFGKDGETGAAWRVLQGEDWDVHLILERYIALIDAEEVDMAGGHTLPEGPFLEGEHRVLWKNNVMELNVLTSLPEKCERLVRFMRNIDLREQEDE